MATALSKNENTPKRPTMRKRAKKPSIGKALYLQITSKNAVGNIEAHEGATVKVYQTVKEYTQLSKDEQERKRQQTQLDRLKIAIQQKLDDLNELAREPHSVDGNPYLFLEAFDLEDHPRFFGHQEAVTEGLQHLRNHPTT